MSLKRQSTDSYRLKEMNESKPRKNGKLTESLDSVYYCIFFEFFDCKGAKYRVTFHCMGF